MENPPTSVLDWWGVNVCNKQRHFPVIQTDRPTDRRTDGQTDGQEKLIQGKIKTRDFITMSGSMLKQTATVSVEVILLHRSKMSHRLHYPQRNLRNGQPVPNQFTQESFSLSGMKLQSSLDAILLLALSESKTWTLLKQSLFKGQFIKKWDVCYHLLSCRSKPIWLAFFCNVLSSNCVQWKWTATMVCQSKSSKNNNFLVYSFHKSMIWLQKTDYFHGSSLVLFWTWQPVCAPHWFGTTRMGVNV